MTKLIGDLCPCPRPQTTPTVASKPTRESNPAAGRSADTWQVAVKNSAAPETPSSLGTHSDNCQSMPTFASFWQAGAGEAVVVHSFFQFPRGLAGDSRRAQRRRCDSTVG